LEQNKVQEEDEAGDDGGVGLLVADSAVELVGFEPRRDHALPVLAQRQKVEAVFPLSVCKEEWR
jgi:hypothetical protein